MKIGDLVEILPRLVPGTSELVCEHYSGVVGRIIDVGTSSCIVRPLYGGVAYAFSTSDLLCLKEREKDNCTSIW